MKMMIKLEHVEKYFGSYIDDKFSPQEYGIAAVKGSGMSELCEKLVTEWLADGTIDALIAENGIA